MKLANLGIILTFVLCVCTAYLATQAQKEAAVATAKLDMLQKQTQAPKMADAASAALLPGQTVPMQMPVAPPVAPVAAAAPAPTPTASAGGLQPLTNPPLPELPKVPELAVTKPVAKGSAKTTIDFPASAVPPLPKPLKMPEPVAGSAGSPAPAVAPSADAPLPLTPLQRRVRDSASVGKIKEAVVDQGFVTLDVGTKKGVKPGMKFDLRRGNAVVGSITISAAEDEEAVADLNPKSVPAGITVMTGDEIIGQILDR